MQVSKIQTVLSRLILEEPTPPGKNQPVHINMRVAGSEEDDSALVAAVPRPPPSWTQPHAIPATPVADKPVPSDPAGTLEIKQNVSEPALPIENQPEPACHDTPSKKRSAPTPAIEDLKLEPARVGLKKRRSDAKTPDIAEKSEPDTGKSLKRLPSESTPDLYEKANALLSITMAELSGSSFGVSKPKQASVVPSKGGFGASVRKWLGKVAVPIVSQALSCEPMESGHLAQHARVRTAKSKKKDCSRINHGS